MLDPRTVAERIVGRVDWQNEVSGFCKCPGEVMHTSSNGKKDCRVSVDGAPTIFCFHASCMPAVHRAHFRSVAEWYQIGPVMGNFTCGSAFKPGCWSRSNENLEGQRFMVIESDTLSRDEVGAIFGYLQRRLRYELHCIVDTAGKSLHAWFDAPRSKVLENRLKRAWRCLV